LDHYEKSDKELKQLENREEQVDGLSKKIVATQADAVKRAKDLSELRKQTAVKLEERIQEQLKELYMEKVKFSVVFKGAEQKESSDIHLTEQGVDKIEFFVSTNPGEPLKPLSKVASG